MLIFAVSNNSDDERKRKGSEGKDDESEEDPESEAGENVNLNDWKKSIDTKENKPGKSILNDNDKGARAKVKGQGR